MDFWERADFISLLQILSIEDRKKRHDIRYACFRVQNYISGGAKAEKKHITLSKKIEKLDGFEGWEKFAVTWDISTVTPIVLVKRKWSVFEEWDQTLERVAEPLPGIENGGKGNFRHGQ